ncbi:hypothetical protein L207DRAFT_571934 [Hyaloscypha variabilis F]|uniref:Heterokaryon incompatibility domain-containing protein n=1 Tax=Hyaloscypha variabilis (strain UAMH 11265 / GT02V1 / F) TaxID=1149755 RepID=A0A2J6R2A2_HYAVF|nr:hypothetical protein L207DRAFT_571934 [Hyaloscypha variabilis F]
MRKKLWNRNSLVRYTWMTAVEDFTKRNLSHPGDKLIAISAIATLVQASLQDDYLAGIWRQHGLAGQLLWRIEKPEAGPRPQEFIAPSWSWASFGGEISYMNWRLLSKSDVTMELLRWEVIPVSPNAPYGAISSAYLHIRSLAMDIRWDNKWQIFRGHQDYQKDEWIQQKRVHNYRSGAKVDMVFYPDRDEFQWSNIQENEGVALTMLEVREYWG